jgi:hypothetical protein
MSLFTRIGIIVGGFALLMPAEIGAWAAWTDVGGLILSATLMTYEYLGARRERVGSAVLPSEEGG